MPLVWMPSLVQTGQSTRIPYMGSQLIASGDRLNWPDAKNHFVLTADGNVVANYGDEALTADHLEAHLEKGDQYFIASGHLVITDPDGTVIGEEFRYCWKPGGEIGVGRNVTVKIAGLTIRAESIDMRRDRWELNHYYVTNDPSRHPFLSVTGDRMTIYPGHDAILEDSQLNLLGTRLFGYQEKDFGLDPRAVGLRFPTPEYRPGKGLGYAWTLGSLIAPNTTIQVHDDASPGDIPGYGAQVTHSFVSADKDPYPITPRSPFTQRFAYSYFDNILVGTPSQEVGTLNQTRRSASLENNFNAGVTGRGYSGEVFSVPISAALELGGKAGPGGYIADIHLSEMDQYRQSYIVRVEQQSSYELPVVKLAPHLFNMVRLDNALFQSDTSFGWLRGTESLIYQPIKELTMGIAAFGGIDMGTPEYDIDPLFYKNGLAARADYRLGPRSFSYMARYDSHLGWFDNEFMITQAMGSLEAFAVYRKYPGDTHYGVTIRIDQIEDLLERRNLKPGHKVNSEGLP